MGEFFKFEDENMDFPFYNGIPQLSKIDWIVFALAPFLIALISLSGGRCIPFVEMLPNGTLPVCYFLVSFIPIAYICHVQDAAAIIHADIDNITHIRQIQDAAVLRNATVDNHRDNQRNQKIHQRF